MSKALQILAFITTMRGLIVWLTWIDVLVISGDSKGVTALKEK